MESSLIVRMKINIDRIFSIQVMVSYYLMAHAESHNHLLNIYMIKKMYISLYYTQPQMFTLFINIQ